MSRTLFFNLHSSAAAQRHKNSGECVNAFTWRLNRKINNNNNLPSQLQFSLIFRNFAQFYASKIITFIFHSGSLTLLLVSCILKSPQSVQICKGKLKHYFVFNNREISLILVFTPTKRSKNFLTDLNDPMKRN